MNPRRWTVLGAVAMAAVVALTLVLLSLRSPEPVVPSLDLDTRGVSLRTVTIYVMAADTLALVPEDRQVVAGASRRDLAAELIDDLARGGEERVATLPVGTRLIHFFEGKPGEITLDLSASVADVDGTSILEDRLSLSALVRTLAENLPPTRRIRLLVEGRPLRRWGDHIRLDPVLEVNRWL